MESGWTLAASCLCGLLVVCVLAGGIRFGLARNGDESAVGFFTRDPFASQLGGSQAPRAAEGAPDSQDSGERHVRHRSRGIHVAAGPAYGSAVCVRLCDGYFFPMGDAAGQWDLAGRETQCASLCPRAPTRLYVIPPEGDGIGAAVALNGQRYSALPVALRYTRTTDNTCTCHAPNEARMMALMNDVTLRRGDSIVTASGISVFRGRSSAPYRVQDFISLANVHRLDTLSPALLAIDKVLRPDRSRTKPLR